MNRQAALGGLGGLAVEFSAAGSPLQPGQHAPAVQQHRDLFGTTVQLAHRLCSQAEPGEIVVSGLVRELCEEDAGRFVALGKRRLKGFPERVPTYRLAWRRY